FRDDEPAHDADVDLLGGILLGRAVPGRFPARGSGAAPDVPGERPARRDARRRLAGDAVAAAAHPDRLGDGLIHDRPADLPLAVGQAFQPDCNAAVDLHSCGPARLVPKARGRDTGLLPANYARIRIRCQLESPTYFFSSSSRPKPPLAGGDLPPFLTLI